MENEIRNILLEIVDNSEISGNITSETNIMTDIGLDSLKLINFIVKIEEELNVSIDFDKFDYEHLTSINKLSKFLEQCKKSM